MPVVIKNSDKTNSFQRFRTYATNRMLPSHAVEENNLFYWRIRILFAILFTGLLLSLIGFVPLFFFVLKYKLWGLAIFEGIAWLIGISLLLAPRIRYEIRATITLLMFYLMGLGIIFSVGPVSGGSAWLFTFAVLAGVLLGTRTAIMALIVNTITIVVIGQLVSEGVFGQNLALFSSIEAIIAAGSSFILLNTIASLSLTVLVKGLVSTLQKESSLISTLKKEQSYLIAATEELELEIEERKRAEAEARENAKRYRLLADNATDIIWTANMNLKFTYVSPSVERIQGYTPEEALCIPFEDFMPPESIDKIMNIFSEELEIESSQQKNRDRTRTMDLKIYHKNSSTMWVEIKTSFLRGEDHNLVGIIGITRDITNRKRLEAQLRQAHKMESISTLAGGIAHQFNNALVGITGSIELLKMDMLVDISGNKSLSHMENSAFRMVSLTNQLLAYARGGKYHPKIIFPSTFLSDTIPILESTLNPGIRIETDFPENVSPVKADPTQLQMILSSIVSNACDAMDKTGRIRISAMDKKVGSELSKQDPEWKPGLYVCLKVEDNGKGMDEEVREKIFEPFFSTKFQGRGLGMAAVYGIVKNHGGWISVDSEPCKGTVVSIFLPPAKTEKRDSEKRSGIKSLKDTGTVLLIDDEEQVMEITRRQLEMLGYHVLAAKSGQEAVKISEKYAGQIHVAILDIVMPGMGGKQTYPLIKKARPGMKVIVCSGYSIDGPARELMNAGADCFIQKPLSIKSLSEKLREVLGKKEAPNPVSGDFIFPEN